VPDGTARSSFSEHCHRCHVCSRGCETTRPHDGALGAADSLHGAKSGGATMQLDPEPGPSDPFDAGVVPIAGDSYAECFDEVM
jgi:hypothetical protein